MYVRRTVWAAAGDGQPIQIHVSWITSLPGTAEDAEKAIRAADPAAAWPETVQQLTGRSITTIVQHTRARRANPFETAALGLPDAAVVVVAHLTTYDEQRRPIDHSRWTWPTDAVRISDYYTTRPGPAADRPDQGGQPPRPTAGAGPSELAEVARQVGPGRTSCRVEDSRREQRGHAAC